MSQHVHIFLHQPEGSAPGRVEPVRSDAVTGTTFQVEGFGSVLVLAGHGRVPGTVARIAADRLAEFDRHAQVADGLRRRVGVRVGDTPCWAWVAGPALAPRLSPRRREARA